MESPFIPYEEEIRELKEELEKYKQRVKELESKIESKTYVEEPEPRMLFFDSISGLYFYSTKERINEVNQQLTKILNNCNEVTLNQYLRALGLEYYQNKETHNYRNDMGWKVKEKLPDDFFDIIYDVTSDGAVASIIEPIIPIKYLRERWESK